MVPIDAEKMPDCRSGLKKINSPAKWRVMRHRFFQKKSDYFYLKGIVKSLTERLGFNNIKSKPIRSSNIFEGESIYFNKSEILNFGIINRKISKFYDINIILL